MTTKIRKGQAPAPARARRVRRALPRSRSSTRRFAPRTRRSAASRRSPGTPTATAARRRSRARPAPATPIPDYDLSVDWLETRDAPRARAGDAGPIRRRRSRVLRRSAARRATTAPARARSRRPSASPSWSREVARQAQDRGRLPRPEPAHLRVRPQDPSVQGLRVDGDAAVPLAVQLLPEPLARPGRRLDERDLRALGRGARRRHRHADALVPGAERAQADDRPAGLRRRRQPRSDLDARQEARARPRRSSSRAGTIRSTSPAAPTAWSCTATSPASRARGARSPTGSTGWA